MIEILNTTSFSRNEFELGLPYTGLIVFWAQDSANGSSLCLGGCNFADKTGLALKIADGTISNQYLLQNSNIREVDLPVAISAGTYNISYFPGATNTDRIGCCVGDIYSLYSVEVPSEDTELQTIIDAQTQLYADVLTKSELSAQVEELTATNTELQERLTIAQEQLASQSKEEEEVSELTIAETLANAQVC